MQSFTKFRGTIGEDNTFIPASEYEWARLKNALLRDQRAITRNQRYFIKFKSEGAKNLAQNHTAKLDDALFRVEAAKPHPAKKQYRETLEELTQFLPFEIAVRLCKPEEHHSQIRRNKVSRERTENAVKSYG